MYLTSYRPQGYEDWRVNDHMREKMLTQALGHELTITLYLLTTLTYILITKALVGVLFLLFFTFVYTQHLIH